MMIRDTHLECTKHRCILARPLRHVSTVDMSDYLREKVESSAQLSPEK
jgi:hypothetical protein